MCPLTGHQKHNVKWLYLLNGTFYCYYYGKFM
jgi:hypothetical protein